MTGAEWLASDCPFDMLQHLEGKLDDKSFMRFSVLCCRRIWPLISDSRSRAIVEATEAFLDARLTSEAAAPILEEWDRAYQAGDLEDMAGGSTLAAIESVYGVGFGHAAQVAKACFESAGYAAANGLRVTSGLRPEVATEAWLTAVLAERLAQCQLLRELFEYQSDSGSKDTEPGEFTDGGT